MHKSHYNQLFALLAIVLFLATLIRSERDQLREENKALKTKLDFAQGKTAQKRFAEYRREEKLASRLGGGQ